MDSCVVPHRSTNRAALWLTAQIGRDAVVSESYGRRQQDVLGSAFMAHPRALKKPFFSSRASRAERRGRGGEKRKGGKGKGKESHLISFLASHSTLQRTRSK